MLLSPLVCKLLKTLTLDVCALHMIFLAGYSIWRYCSHLSYYYYYHYYYYQKQRVTLSDITSNMPARPPSLSTYKHHISQIFEWRSSRCVTSDYILIIHSQHNYTVYILYSGYRFRSISDHHSGPSYLKFSKTWNAEILQMFALVWDPIHINILRYK